ncbi:MAG: peptidoglycan DD-metalloendopeptidase family protein [Marinobacterium sp.]|nr:peptidoglycan DD-metalloendopeptidase family protein [Marinobacterium sp.]
MRSFLRVLTLSLPAVAMLSLPDHSLAAQQASETQLQQLNRQVSQLQKQLDSRETKAQRLLKTVRESDTRISTLVQELAAMDAQLSNLINNAQTLKNRRDALRAELARRVGRIDLQIRQQHRMGNQPRLELLMNLRSPDDLNRQLRYFDNVNKALADQLAGFRDQLSALENTETALDDNAKAMIDKRAELAAQHKKLEQAQAWRHKLLADLNERIKKDRKNLSSLKLDQQKMQQLLGDLQRSLDLSQLASQDRAFRELKGNLPWPLRGSVQRAFGNKRDGISFDGILISGNTGNAVKAVQHGRVAFADWLRGYGMVLIIDHGSGYMSLYGYNQSLLRAAGDWVSAGETIATVGQSGGHTEPGLYFAIRYKERAVDPITWLRRR